MTLMLLSIVDTIDMGLDMLSDVVATVEGFIAYRTLVFLLSNVNTIDMSLEVTFT